ncbi:MAG: hypothetical protein R3C59_04780 [Planctomycetaceae bacterium]
MTSVTLTSASIPWRMRPDLMVARLSFSDRIGYSIKDPVASRFFQLREEEYVVLSALDGHITLEELQQAFARRFAPLQLGTRQLQSYLASLERQGLIIGDVPGRAQRLQRRRDEIARGEWINHLTGFLAIRFRGLDPQSFLSRIYPLASWLFDVRVVVAALLLMASAITLLLVQFETLVTRLPEFQAFFGADNLLLMALAIGAVKVLHEIGHALSCHHFGGECHELGLMLLVFTPCLYCDVSDAWLMPSKWHRIAISAAGIFVELTLAAMCTLLWWFTEPGTLNSLLLNVMIVCSVNTVLFNGNPLLRFDGYFVLADLVEVPNLRQTAGHALNSRLSELCLGVPSVPVRMLPEKRSFLILYAAAAAVYRVLIVFGILWMLHAVLGSRGLLPVAHLLAAVLLSVMAVGIVHSGKGLMRRLRSDTTIRKPRVLATAVVLAGVMAGAFLMPLPNRISAPCLADVRNAEAVFVVESGRIPLSGATVFAGASVQAGDLLVRLQNAEIARRLAVATGRIAVLESRLTSLERRRVEEPALTAQIPATQQSLSDLQQQLSELKQQQQHLTLTAPIAGTILVAEFTEAEDGSDIEFVRCDPLDPRRAGDTLLSGTTFCQIGDPSQMDAVVLVDQADVELVNVGQPVQIWFNSMPDTVLSGTVSRLSESEVQDVPRNLIAADMLATVSDSSGQRRPASVVYRVRVMLDTPVTLPSNSTGWAAIRTAPQTLASRLMRFASGTLRFTADFSEQ